MRRLTVGRFLDVVAILVIAYAAYRVFVVPRYLALGAAHPAPRVTYQTLAGPPFVLMQHRGRLVFMDFYASWCEPCKISLPWVEHYARAHPEVDVVPIDVGEPPAVVASFAKSYKLQNVAYDTQALSSGFFQINGFPTMVVVDPQGRIRATWQGLNPALQMNMANAEKVLAKTP